MPKISWQRHRLAELTAGLNLGKESLHTQDEVSEGGEKDEADGGHCLFQGILGRPASDWNSVEDCEEEGPLELVTRKSEQGKIGQVLGVILVVGRSVLWIVQLSV